MSLRKIVALGLLALIAAGCSVVDLMSGRVPASLTVGPDRALEDFEIIDPYAVPGYWAKAQLHVHTNQSIDGKWSIEAALETYAKRGYDFVAITDHDAVTIPTAAPPALTVVRGEEHTLSQPFYPIGQHALFLFIERRPSGASIDEKFDDVVSQGGLAIVAHPSWNGAGGNGEWHSWQLAAAPPFHLMEVSNPHSDPDRDTQLWHETAWLRGPHQPIWAVAVDDAHDAGGVDRGWTMVKVEGSDPAHLRSALLRGSHYATTGIVAEFGVDDGGAIVAKSSEPAKIVFLNAANKSVLTLPSAMEGKYEPLGTEGFVRVEIHGLASKKRAWSQPFWLVER